ncbi:hypothetical protein SAMN05444266_109251 [Chitinophaga jiangningensis]|uniref:Nitroimidazol reductase NimA, pyridoxamine 5'-phosphate oxidase superfamily n=1 Tax=Chitinophaga jiangningensis TaxID=1419482 RepID=A0A1M7KCL9_9BACT|nr:pyridoxamine 5'-phosphate oxidase family protein [Chitinophaga jiangningensis]SHM62971.1 hypothetical protein SAMN05444266_109251 [Chitinophaga jiangningensis]
MLGNLLPEQIEDILTRHVTGRIGCTDGQQPYIVPVSYAYNGTYLVAHSKPGLKIDIMRKNAAVCFEVDEIDDLVNWRSVLVRGRYQEVTDPREKYYLMKFLVGHLQQYHASELAVLNEMSKGLDIQGEAPPIIRPIVFKITVIEKTGRYEKGMTGHGMAES